MYFDLARTSVARTSLRIRLHSAMHLRANSFRRRSPAVELTGAWGAGMRTGYRLGGILRAKVTTSTTIPISMSIGNSNGLFHRLPACAHPVPCHLAPPHRTRAGMARGIHG